MTDRVRHLFDLLDAEPAAEFEASLRGRVLDELATLGGSPPGEPTQKEPEEFMLITDQPEAPFTQRRMRRSRHVTLILVSVAAAAALVAIGISVSRRDEPTGPASAPKAPTTLTARTTLSDSRLFQVKSDGVNLWAGTTSTDLLRVDPATGQVAETLTLPAAATETWMETYRGKLYVFTRAGIVIVDGATKSVSEPRATGNVSGLTALAFTDESAWVLKSTGNGLVLEQWDHELTTKRREVSIGQFEPGGMVGVGNSFYLSTNDRGLLHYDDAGTQIGSIAGVGYSFDPGYGDGSVWVPNYDTGDVLRIDPATDSIVARISVATWKVHSVAITPGAVLATSWSDSTLSAVDPTTNLKTAQVGTHDGPMSLTVFDGVVWVASDGELDSFLPA